MLNMQIAHNWFAFTTKAKIITNNLAREDKSLVSVVRTQRRMKICEKFTIILPGRQKENRPRRKAQTNMWRSLGHRQPEEMRCPANTMKWPWRSLEGDQPTSRPDDRRCRAPSKLAAVSNWKTSDRRVRVRVRRGTAVLSVCMWCIDVCVWVALSREIKSGITILRSIASVIEPHSRRNVCRKSNWLTLLQRVFRLWKNISFRLSRRKVKEDSMGRAKQPAQQLNKFVPKF